jgi:hypothetical protein
VHQVSREELVQPGSDEPAHAFLPPSLCENTHVRHERVFWNEQGEVDIDNSRRKKIRKISKEGAAER